MRWSSLSPGWSTRTVRSPFGKIEPWQRNQYAIVLTVATANLGFNFSQPFLPLYVRYLGVTDVSQAALWSGLLVGITPLFSSLLAPFWGAMADRVGYKLIVLRALFGISLMALALAFAPDVVWAFWARLIMGLLSGFTPMAMALAISTGPRDRVGQVVGLIQAAQFLPLAFGPPIGGLLSDRFDIRWNFVIASIITAVAAGLLIFLLEEPPDVRGRRKETGPRRGLLSLLTIPGFAPTLVVLFIAQFTDRSLPPILPLYLIEIETPTAQLATVTGLVIAGGAVAASVSATLYGRATRPGRTYRMLLLALGGGAVAMAMLAVAARWELVLLLRLLLGLLAGGSITLAYTLGARIVPPERAGLALGVLSGCTGLGGAISPLLVGVIGSLDLRSVFLTSSALYIVAALLAATALRAIDQPVAP